ncbi:MAG: hypothetical protein HFH88_14870 [Lachnospiraceae bacterium]|nr:hypothetical protein [Lachnospiraceae bacterium]
MPEKLMQEILEMEYPSKEIEKGMIEEGVSRKSIAAAYGFAVALEKVAELIRTHMIAEDDWIYCGDGKNLPEERESIFARFKGTDKWTPAMFEKSSSKVIVTVESENGERATMNACTLDGKWKIDSVFVKDRVIAWMPFPESYNPKKTVGDDYKQRIMKRFLKVE